MLLKLTALPLVLSVVLASTQTFAQSVEMTKVVEYKNADADPENIWKPDELRPFGGANAVRKSRGAAITEYRADTSAGTFILSQVLSDDCSTQLCPARLVKLNENGRATLMVSDMMYIGGPFNLDVKNRVLHNDNYKFYF